jgi:hypothetical protein
MTPSDGLFAPWQVAQRQTVSSEILPIWSIP